MEKSTAGESSRSSTRELKLSPNEMDVEELGPNKKETLSRGAAKRQQIKDKKHPRQPEGEDLSWSVEGTSQANGHVNSKDLANRPKQERA